VTPPESRATMPLAQLCDAELLARPPAQPLARRMRLVMAMRRKDDEEAGNREQRVSVYSSVAHIFPAKSRIGWEFDHFNLKSNMVSIFSTHGVAHPLAVSDFPAKGERTVDLSFFL
jgi:hypothetical protein